MNTTSLSLNPLLRQSVGFDRLNDLFESGLRSKDKVSTYPLYNIEKHGEDNYFIYMAVVGFHEKDLNVIVQDDQLTISGSINTTEDDGIEYLHRGIETKSFERTFRLADHMHVTSAEINDGLLRVAVVREIPEEAKPRMIPIKGEVEKGSNRAKILDANDNKKAN